ncbi:hypothetical protein B4135_1595 [Caldibacillus debilis]|uniref:Uncharacterized protein n=1 Tax=Caldibacillus debilis TaxID=301148 RepID=A0A150MCJ2_9BACI|nr:hypothetical protein B4135_1595 [Caldibacillus debilis]
MRPGGKSGGYSIHTFKCLHRRGRNGEKFSSCYAHFFTNWRGKFVRRSPRFHPEPSRMSLHLFSAASNIMERSFPLPPRKRRDLAAEDGSPCLAKGESAASGAPYPKNGGGSSGRTGFPKHSSLIFPARKTV